MNARTEILQICNLALMINELNGSKKVVVDFGGNVAHVCVFIYPTGSVAPVDYLHTESDKPEAHLELRNIRQQLELVLADQEAQAKAMEKAA